MRAGRINVEKSSPFAKIQVLNIPSAAGISLIQQLIQADYTLACLSRSPSAQMISVWGKREGEKEEEGTKRKQ